MDTTLGRIRIYDLLGVFLTGMIVLAIGIWADLMPLLIESSESDAIKISIFILISIPTGIIAHELGSIFDHRFFRAMDTAVSCFLNDNNPIIKNPIEVSDYRKLANKLLKKSENNCSFNADQQQYLYQRCRAYLEACGKDDKGLYLYSLYNMSRNLTSSLPIIALIHLVYYKYSANLYIVAILIAATLIFYRRTKRFAAYPIREILRHYWAVSYDKKT